MQKSSSEPRFRRNLRNQHDHIFPIHKLEYSLWDKPSGYTVGRITKHKSSMPFLKKSVIVCSPPPIWSKDTAIEKLDPESSNPILDHLKNFFWCLSLIWMLSNIILFHSPLHVDCLDIIIQNWIETKLLHHSNLFPDKISQIWIRIPSRS